MNVFDVLASLSIVADYIGIDGGWVNQYQWAVMTIAHFLGFTIQYPLG